MSTIRRRPRDRVPLLWQVFHQDLGLTTSELTAFWRAIVTAEDPWVQALRHTWVQLDAQRGQPGLFAQLMATLPPKRYIGLLEKLVAEKPACRQVASRIEEGVLRWTNKRGEWFIEIIEQPHAS